MSDSNVYDPRSYGAKCDLVNDDSAALTATLTVAGASVPALGAATVLVPYPGIRLGSSFAGTIPPGVTVRGEPPAFAGIANVNPLTTASAAIFVTSTTQVPFTFATTGPLSVYPQSGIENLVFYWPNQVAPTTTSPTPTVYPFAVQMTDQTTFVRLRNLCFVNAYNGILVAGGEYDISSVRMGALNIGLQLNTAASAGWARIKDFMHILSWSSGQGFPTNLDTWYRQNTNACVIDVVNGVGIQASNIGGFWGYRFIRLQGNATSDWCNVDADSFYLPIDARGTGGTVTGLGASFTNLKTGYSTTVGAAGAPIMFAGSSSNIRWTGGSYWGAWPQEISPRSTDLCDISHVNGYNPVGVLTAPALPAGLGSGNAVINPFPYSVEVVVNAGTGVSGVFFTNTRKPAAGFDSIPANGKGYYVLGAGEGIYFGTNLPASWSWAGL